MTIKNDYKTAVCVWLNYFLNYCYIESFPYMLLCSEECGNIPTKQFCKYVETHKLVRSMCKVYHITFMLIIRML